MKTLDEVIKSLEWCIDDSHDDCEGCPYDTGEVTDCHERNIDALHYLKAYRKVTDVLHKHGFGSVWGITLPNPERVEGKPDIDGSMNQPLTWDELKQMEGKPVWAEEKYSFSNEWHGRWEVICSVWDYEWDDDPYLSMTDEEYRHKNDMGKTWQAYRKEKEAPLSERLIDVLREVRGEK